jgi:hypothetical protein
LLYGASKRPRNGGTAFLLGAGARWLYSVSKNPCLFKSCSGLDLLHRSTAAHAKIMNTPILTPGMKIVHPNHGEGIVEKVSTGSAEIRFGNILRTIDPRLADIKVPEPMVKVGEVEVPLKTFVQGIVESTVNELGIEQPDASVSELGLRWIKGKLVMHPSDPTLQTKEVPLETFFHKIVMVRNQLRVLEQKINAHEKLDDAEKVEMQQYITRCYGSLTTFNILFKEKEDQF